MSQSTPGEKTAEVKKGANASDKGSSKAKNEKAKKEFVPKKTEELNKKTEEKVVYDAALFLQEDAIASAKVQKTEKSGAKSAATGEKEQKPKKSARAPSSNTGVSNEVDALQKLLIAKENEIGRLQKHIDKQDTKVDGLNKITDNLKDQLKQSSSGGDLSSTVASLNEQLRKQTALNRL